MVGRHHDLGLTRCGFSLIVDPGNLHRVALLGAGLLAGAVTCGTAARQVPIDQVQEVLSLYRERYRGFTAKHFHDKLRQHHGFTLGYTWTKLRLQAAGLVEKAPRRSAHRKKRPRRPLTGMLLHQDGSRHRWLPGIALDLIVTMDDATSAIYSAFLVDEEGTQSSFRGLLEVIEGLVLMPRPPSRSTPASARRETRSSCCRAPL